LCPADPIDVCQSDFHPLVRWKIHARDTCHSNLQLPLTLFVLGIDADHTHHTLAVHDLALVTDLFYRRSYLHRSPTPPTT
jgi:hypothetical protein